jgi:hypothetical protein
MVMLMFQLHYPKTPDGLAPTDSVSASTGSYSLAPDSNSSGADSGLASLSGRFDSGAAAKGGGPETADLQDAGEVDSPSPTQGSDGDLGDFCPHILHEPHIPVPIAMVNRRPTGSELFRLLSRTRADFCSAWTLFRPPLPTRCRLAQRHALCPKERLHVCFTSANFGSFHTELFARTAKRLHLMLRP